MTRRFACRSEETLPLGGVVAGSKSLTEEATLGNSARSEGSAGSASSWAA